MSSYVACVKKKLRVMSLGEDVIGSICCRNCQDYCFIVLDIFLALTISQLKHSHCLGHKLSKDKLNMYLFVL